MGLQVHGDHNVNEQTEGDENNNLWLNNDEGELDQGDLVLDEASIFYDEFPPLPDFPCMSSSSSSSSTPATVKPIGGGSSSSSSSSSSASSSAAGADHNSMISIDSMGQRLQKVYGQYNPALADTPRNEAALSSTASMEIYDTQQQQQQQQEEGNNNMIDGGGGAGLDDCLELDIMENFGYMDLLENGDLFDTSCIFQSDDGTNLLDELHQEPVPQFDPPPQGEEMMMMMTTTTTTNKGIVSPQLDGAGSEDLAMVFLEWLKNNKETVSAEDLRRVKIKKSTIECAANRLGGGKEGMKQLLKLILEWVQTNHLQKRRIHNNSITESSPLVNSDPVNNFSQQYQDPNPSTFNNTIQWTTQPHPYFFPDPVSGFPPMPGYIPDPFVNAGSTSTMNPYQNPADGYHNLFGSMPHPWSPPQFGLTSNCTAYSGNNLPAGGPSIRAHPGTTAFSQYSYNQYLPGHGGSGGEHSRLTRLGSSATKEARKKRMARHRRLLSHHRTHNHQNVHSQQNQVGLDHQQQHARFGNDNSVPTAFPPQPNVPPPNWVYWPTPAPMAVAPSAMPIEPQPHAAVQSVVEDQMPPQAPSYQRQGAAASDRRQGWKPEKNLKFLLQKVLKQSDVGSLGRIVLPKKEAETHLPELEARDGISIAMEDIGTSRVWNMRYRFWPNNKSRMYLLENTGDFVRANGLQEGDFIVIYSDVKCGKYLIRGVKVRQPAGQKPETKKAGKAQKSGSSSTPNANETQKTPMK